MVQSTKDNAKLKADELADRARNGDVEALKALEKIVVCFERWKKALGDQREANRKAKEIEGAAEATFQNAIEAGLPTNADPNAIFEKLRSVESTYQEQQDAHAKAVELRTEAAEKVKKAAAKLERATQDGAQMTIPGVED
jgi:hypothetical protein